jgi:hypothetical protein
MSPSVVLPIAQPVGRRPAVGKKEEEREGQHKRSNDHVQEHEVMIADRRLSPPG